MPRGTAARVVARRCRHDAARLERALVAHPAPRQPRSRAQYPDLAGEGGATARGLAMVAAVRCDSIVELRRTAREQPSARLFWHNVSEVSQSVAKCRKRAAAVGCRITHHAFDSGDAQPRPC